MAAWKENIEEKALLFITERGFLNTEEDECQFVYIKRCKTQPYSHRTSLCCSGNLFFLMFTDYHSVEGHMLKADGDLGMGTSAKFTSYFLLP